MKRDFDLAEGYRMMRVVADARGGLTQDSH
jgi:hypothetical protein